MVTVLEPFAEKMARLVAEKQGQPVEYGVAKGENFTFDVSRGVQSELSFKNEHTESFSTPLARNLTNGPHTIELVTAGDGEVALDSFYIYQPPEHD